DAEGAHHQGHDHGDDDGRVPDPVRGQPADQRRDDDDQGPADLSRADLSRAELRRAGPSRAGRVPRLNRAARSRPAPAVGAHWPATGICGIRRNVTTWGPFLRSAVEQIQPASACVLRTSLPQPIGGSMHTWYCPAGTLAAKSWAGLRTPDAALASDP